MRILNRPMFRYGGPIKEGVMHGMRNGGRAALVGNPVYPKTDGREHHNVWRTIFGLGAKPALAQTGKKTVGSVVTQKATPYLQKIKELFTGKQVPGGPMTGELYKTPFVQGTKTTFAPMGTPATNQWLYGGAQRVLTPVTGAVTTGAKKAWQVAKPYTGALTIAGVTYSLLKPDGTPKTIEELKVETGANEKELHTAAKVIDPDAAAKLAKKQQNERIQKYMDMMGYDSAKKGALSKALIDASALTQDATTEAGSLKEADWGKLINRMIQTTSKRLEKPEQIREAVGLMSVKAAIQKDMEDPEAKKLRRMQIKKIEDELEGNSFAENKILTAKSAPGQPGYDLAVEITKGKDFKGNLVDSDEWLKSLEKMKDSDDFVGQNEKQLIKGYTEKLISGKNYEDGHYTVGDNLVTIKDSIVIAVE